MSDTLDRLAEYARGHTTLNLATEGPAGLWAAAVLYVVDDFRFYFTSEASTRHGRNLQATGRAAGTINDDCTEWITMKGVQLEGAVEPVRDRAELERVVGAYLRRFPFAAALWHGETDPARIAADPGSHGFFRLAPARLFFTDNEHAPGVREERSFTTTS